MDQKLNEVKVEKSLGAVMLAYCRIIKELLMLVIVTEVLLKALGAKGVLASRYLHVVEAWHIWIAAVAYLIMGMIIVSAIWRNKAYVRFLARRISRTYRQTA